MRKIRNIFLILILTCLVGCEKSTKTEETLYYSGECTNKGNICTSSEIVDGILLNVQVNETDSYDFYVLNNDENTMTLIMKDNLTSDDWYDEAINFNGPVRLFTSLAYETKDWSNVPNIDYYRYDDYGRKSYLDYCKRDIIAKGYECEEEAAVGYDYVTIINNVIYIKYNVYSDNNLDGFSVYYNTKARAVTYEEIMDIYNNNNYKYPDWLIANLNDGDGYWTLTSSADMTTGYMQGAFAMIKKNSEPSLESKFVVNTSSDNVIGIRPVITILKEEK